MAKFAFKTEDGREVDIESLKLDGGCVYIEDAFYTNTDKPISIADAEYLEDIYQEKLRFNYVEGMSDNTDF